MLHGSLCQEQFSRSFDVWHGRACGGAGRVPTEVGAGGVVSIRSALGNDTAFEMRDAAEGRGKLGDVANLNC